MQEMVNVYFFGKKYSVPADLTIMTAMEYAGYTLKRGCGCRHGFCGACATIYRIKGVNELKTCLACQTQVQEGMYVASIPFFPTDKRTYDINEIKPNQQIMMELYPEIYSCIGCNACMIACRAENNIPVVGRDQMARGRALDWIRIDRYFTEKGTLTSIPVACQQCGKAPCESVCPVNATVHTTEGLNAMVYARCWGTRYLSLIHI